MFRYVMLVIELVTCAIYIIYSHRHVSTIPTDAVANLAVQVIIKYVLLYSTCVFYLIRLMKVIVTITAMFYDVTSSVSVLLIRSY